MLHPALKRLISLSVLTGASFATCAEAVSPWPEKGTYSFPNEQGSELGVYYSVPPAAGPQTPILIVIPGAQRNAEVYRDAWHALALSNGFIVLAIELAEENFPSEYEYNSGGVVTASGQSVPQSQWTFAVIEPLFEDFRQKYGSERETFSLYGHSAGGQFVLNYLLLMPRAHVERAVAANPAFFPMAKSDEPYPFGLQAAPLSPDAIQKWLELPIVLLLGDRDLDPRNRPLSNSPRARRQGPHVFSRGLAFYASVVTLAAERGFELAWKLEVVHGVGHSNEHMASHAVAYLFPK